ncbi:MAG: gliding motility-associated C-terminal domain-containing protein [Bacteroidaceae bacterium]|nr:gliding motility-associated C-terminal domain-containing protein [Bacteroidaceae bacterium]
MVRKSIGWRTLTFAAIALFIFTAASKGGVMNDEGPTAYQKMVIDTAGVGQEYSQYSGSAPVVTHFTANAENAGPYTPLYEWHIYKPGEESSPYLVRYEADFDYTFTETGKSYVSLQISFVNGNDTIAYEMAEPFTVEAWSSVLAVPNAFSPNGDGTNDVFRVKRDGYQSIISFHGYIFNRHGKKLFEWTDITDGWDGTSGGHPVADGVYYVRIDARGADGKHYNIKKAINLLRGYTYNSAGEN